MGSLIVRRGCNKAERKASKVTAEVSKVTLTKSGAFLYIGGELPNGESLRVWIAADAALRALVPLAKLATGECEDDCA